MLNNDIGVTIVITVLALWSFIWRGIALWRASRQSQRNWFIVFLVPINTIGILELIYLFKFAEKKLTVKEIQSWFSSK